MYEINEIVLKFTDRCIEINIIEESTILKYYEEYCALYDMLDEQVNESKHWRWTQKGIWFACNYWRIGDVKDKGTEKCDIKAPGSNDQMPTELHGKWLYWNPDSKEWITTGKDITIEFSKELPYNKDSTL